MNKPIIEVGTQRYYVSKYVSAVHIITTLEALHDIILSTYLSTSRRKGLQDYVFSIPKLRLSSKRFQSVATNTEIEEMERIS